MSGKSTDSVKSQQKPKNSLSHGKLYVIPQHLPSFAHLKHLGSLRVFCRLTAEHKAWIKDLVEKGYRKRAIAAEAARNYFGQELSRSIIMDPETLKRILVVLNLSDSKGVIDVPVSNESLILFMLL